MAVTEVMGDEDHSLLFESGQTKKGRNGEPSKIAGKRGLPENNVEGWFQKSEGNGFQANGELQQRVDEVGDSICRSNLDKVCAEGKFANVQEEHSKGNGLKISDWAANCSAEGKCISVFIGNIPPHANNRWVFDIFNKIGRVADYYVSGKVSKFSKKPFGFVRFHSLEDANRAVDHFIGVWVEGFRLEVELARFPKRSEILKSVCKAQTILDEDRVVSKEISGIAQKHNSWFNSTKSFAQVLMGNAKDALEDGGITTSSRIKVRVEVKDCGWLNVSAVAKIKWGISFGEVTKGLMKNVMGLLSIKRLGIRKVILSFSSEKERGLAISNGDWGDLVENVGEWKGELVCADKLWRLSCIGIPINAWNSGSFRSIAEVWGSLVYIDQSTTSGEDFSVANFVIEAQAEFSNSVIDLLVNNEIFMVKVEGIEWELESGFLDRNTQVFGEAVGVKGSEAMTHITEPDLMYHNNELFSTVAKQNEEMGPVSLIRGQISSKHKIKERADLFLCSKSKEVILGLSNDQIVEYGTANIQQQAIQKFVSEASNFNCDKFVEADPSVVYGTNAGIVRIDPTPVLGKEVLAEHVWEVQTGQSGGLDDGRDSQEGSNNSVRKISKENGSGADVDKVGGGDSVDGLDYKGGMVLDGHESKDQQPICSGITNRISGGIEDEVFAMLDLGNSLDIPNASLFEDEVRNASLEEFESEICSIGVRVKSKRKNVRKSKVNFGCRLKKG